MDPITIDLNGIGQIGPLGYLMAYAFMGMLAGGISWRNMIMSGNGCSTAKGESHVAVAVVSGIVGGIFLITTLGTSCQMLDIALAKTAATPDALVIPDTLAIPDSTSVTALDTPEYKPSGSTVPGPYYVTINDWEYTVSTEERLTVTQWEDLQYISRYNTNALAFEMRCHSLHIPISNIMRHADGAIIFTKQVGT